MSARVYVAMHMPDDRVRCINDPTYIPIQCGKALFRPEQNNGQFLPELGDDTGDNISLKNHSYSEQSGLYWIWKNDDSGPDDIVGLNHYRRYFKEPDSPNYNQQLMSAETMSQWLTEVTFIVNGCDTHSYPLCEGDETIYDAYCRIHHKADMDNALIGIQKLYPELFDIMEHEIKQCGAMCPCNLIITKKKYLDEWCEFFFSVCVYIESVTDLTSPEYDGYQGRVFGFLAERLLRAWLIARGYTGRAGGSLDWTEYVAKHKEA